LGVGPMRGVYIAAVSAVTAECAEGMLAQQNLSKESLSPVIV